MANRLRSRGLGALLAAALLGGCATLESPPADLRVGEGRLIHAEWTIDEPEFNAPRVSGYVVNTYYYFAGQVQVLVESLDEQGQVLERRFQWVPGGVPPTHRAYFEVRDLPPAADYRVTVPNYTWQDRADGVFGRWGRF
jgi:hypothetical protein